MKRDDRRDRGSGPDPGDTPSFTTGVGCALIAVGVLAGASGLAALAGLGDQIELDFFGLAVADTVGRILWTTGGAVAIVVGWLVLRRAGDRRVH